VLRENGDSIHLYELEGYVFFGSSEAVFERIRRHGAQSSVPVRSIILDLSRITGYDSSAVNTLNKLRGYCKKHDIELVICGTDREGFQQLFANARSDAVSDIQFFAEPIKALDWAEEFLLTSLQTEVPGNAAGEGLAPWLSAEFGITVEADIIDRYFERIEAPAGKCLYGQGQAADTIDFITSGTVAMMLALGSGREQCVRRSSRQTIIGEMGFFRQAERSASVIAETATVLYSLSRNSFERLRLDHPLIHDALVLFVIRILAERLDMATAELTTMRHADSDGPRSR
jgi:SulP family sulfate permease